MRGRHSQTFSINKNLNLAAIHWTPSVSLALTPHVQKRNNFSVFPQSFLLIITTKVTCP